MLSMVGGLRTGRLRVPATPGFPRMSLLGSMSHPGPVWAWRSCPARLRPSFSPPPLIPESPNLASPARPGSCLGSLLCPSSSVPQDLVCADCFLLSHCSCPDLPTSPRWPLPVPSIPVPFYTSPVFFLRPPCHGVWSTRPTSSGFLPSPRKSMWTLPAGLRVWPSPPTALSFQILLTMALGAAGAVGSGPGHRGGTG